MRSTARVPVLLILGLLLIGAFVAWLVSRETDDVASAPAYPPNAYVHGASLDEWSARHWQWTLGFPVGISPGQDASSESCTLGQDGPVWFMPRNLAPCTVPEGAIVMIPVAGGSCSSVEAAPFWGEDEESLRACAAREAERYANISVTVDGEPIPGIERYRTSTPLFNAFLPERNVLGVDAGAAWFVADGYSVLLRPLPPGEHTIIVHTETADGIVLPDKLLELTVVDPSWASPAVHEVEVAPRATPAGTPGATPVASPMATPVAS
jgi:hypothetical protein